MELLGFVMISVKNLNKSFNSEHVVKDLSFDIKPGEVVGFLGPNGAGKSTTMKMLTGFLPMSSGSVQIAGIDIRKNKRKALKLIGYLPEGAPSYSEMTVYEFLLFIAKIRKIKSSECQKAIGDVATKLELQSVMDKTIESLSKGFKRRVGLAQAIIHDPQILLLDEPTDGLDPNQKHQVRELIKNLAKNKIVIISTHIMEEVSAVCNRVIIIANGKKKFDGTADNLMAESRVHNAVVFTMSYAADISGILEIAGVADLKFNRQTGEHTVFAERGHSILTALNAHFTHNQMPVDSIYPLQGNLDEVFRHITSNDYHYVDNQSEQERL